MLRLGDSRAVLRELPTNSVDAVGCDPPAGIEFMSRKWDKFGKRSTVRGKLSKISKRERVNVESECGAFVVAMSQIFREVRRVLKPGGHVLGWAIPRTSHRLATALENAGFEIRDVVHHVYGQGFPKGTTLDKAIDRATNRDRGSGELKFRGNRDEVLCVTRWIRETRDRLGFTNSEIDDAFGFRGMAGHWTSAKSQPEIPSPEQWSQLLALFEVGAPEEIETLVDRLNGRKGQPGDAFAERPVVARTISSLGGTVAAGLIGSPEAAEKIAEHKDKVYDVTEPATELAARWAGWHTGLKPAVEHWILARAPLDRESVAANVVEHGTGAIHVEACRVAWGKRGVEWREPDAPRAPGSGASFSGGGFGEAPSPNGRHPANLVLSHSPHCADDACAEDCPIAIMDAQSGYLRTGYAKQHSEVRGATSFGSGADVHYADVEHGGGASRFFYTPKPSRSEREAGCEHLPTKTPAELTGRVEGSAGLAGTDEFDGNPYSGANYKTPLHNFHPTLKSIALMRWLVRLITPIRGVVLDPFMGSGTTGCACAIEGFGFVGVERESDYFAIAEARIAHWTREAEAGRVE